MRRFFLTSAAVLFSAALLHAQAPVAELVSVEKIWDKAPHNGFTDLTSHLGPAIREQLPADDLATGIVNGKLNALPVSYSARVMLWNQGTFDKLKLPLPRTWDDLFAAGRHFKQALGAGCFASPSSQSLIS